MTRQTVMGYGDFDAGVRAAEAWPRLLDAVSALVAAGPPKAVAARLGIDETTLSRKLIADPDRSHRNHLHVREMVMLLVSAPAKHAETVLVELAAACRFAVVPIKDQTPEERLEQLERQVADRFGAAGAELVEKNRRRR